mgnify:CR=1 FL=1
MVLNRKGVQFSAITIIALTLLTADDYGSISTSRPGITNPTTAVPAGLYQFEIGTNLESSPGQDTTIAIPILLRMGVFKNTELQVGYTNQFLTLGLLYGEIKLINGLNNSVIITTSLSKNNDDLTEYSAYLPVSYFFKNGFSISSQTSGTFFSNKDLDPVINYSIAFGSGFNDRTSWFIEVFQSHVTGQEFGPADKPVLLDYGFTYLSENNIQFDISMGINFQIENSDIIEHSRFLEWGFSFRLPE